MSDVLHWLARMAKHETWCNETAAYFLSKYVNFLTDVSRNTVQVSSIRFITVIYYLFEFVTSDKLLPIGQSRNRTSIWFLLKYFCLMYYCSPLQNNNRTSITVVARQNIAVNLYSPFILWVLNIRTWCVHGASKEEQTFYLRYDIYI